MPILTSDQILERMKSGEIKFTPSLDSFQLQPHSVDLRLGFTFMVPKLWQVTAKGREALNLDYFHLDRPQYFEIMELEKGNFFEILPQEYIMVSTLESVKLPNNLTAVLYPRSSVNRKGLSVDLSGIVNAGYEGQLVIPLKNNTRAQTIRLYPGERFCQIVFEELSHPVEPSKSKYHKKDVVSGVVADKISEENELIMKGEVSELKSRFKLE